MTDTVYQFGIMAATFVFYKVIDYGIRKLIKEDADDIIESYIEELD